jgi:hypothetical protein
MAQPGGRRVPDASDEIARAGSCEETARAGSGAETTRAGSGKETPCASSGKKTTPRRQAGRRWRRAVPKAAKTPGTKDGQPGLGRHACRAGSGAIAIRLCC